MLSSWLLLLLFSGLFGLLLTRLKPTTKSAKELSASRREPLPPGPRGLPIIGSLHMIGALPHIDLAELAKLHGPIMYLKLGVVPTIVISSPAAAEQVLRTHDIVFANRPHSEIFDYMTYGLKSFAYSGYGPQWRALRKLCIAGMLTPQKLEASRRVRTEEVDRLVERMRGPATAGEAFNLTKMAFAVMGAVVCRLIVGKRFLEEKVDGVTFREHYEETMKFVGAFDLTGCVPAFLAKFDLQGRRGRAKELRAELDVFLEGIINEHLADKGVGREPDLLDFLLDKLDSNEELDFPLERDNIKGVIMDLFEGGLDTAPISVEWCVSEVLRKPRVMAKIKEELARVVGPERIVEESDLPNLEYLGIVLKESMRLHPLSPILFHYNYEDCVVDNYLIPAKSNVFVNLWTTGRDPDAWPDPHEFIPERFVGKNIDFRGLDFSFLPFGSGRRMCPGRQLGHTMVMFMLARLFHCFDLELPNGMLPDQLDMEENYIHTVRRRNELWVVPKMAHKMV